MMEFYAARGPRLTLDPGSVLDIGACIVDGVDLSPHRAIPDDGDPRIDHSLEGFLFTCGPDHIRHPEPIEGAADGRKYPLHGSFSSHPAKVLLTTTDDNGDAVCEAEVAVQLAQGGTALLSRRWRIDAATGVVHLNDRVTNTGTAAFPAFLMYHMNIGARHFDDGVRLAGAMLEGGGFPWAFGEGDGGVFCVLAERAGEEWATITLGPIAAIGGRSLKVSFRTDTLPHLQIWRNQKAPAHVFGIEPVSHRWVSRAELGAGGEFTMLKPRESRDYALSFTFIGA
ncbi:aldose 1-epimerase family protein [Rhizobiaceae bacterium n13]|uniref:Aldose 1-epimerase family protein n=1 Tax=Ferirhizobium litorale TaxID=2927786 RepID=A0AAE3U5K4_9HYPH|nr:aldose 1-epimerase family protein [Fererhizobium litorale]MDI7863751.1 aldose 1-epimerase family protein [Fererhizobium litorale]MDI7924149.1 aldose 1-epimerase family protein [Fererhizobium litorale]